MKGVSHKIVSFSSAGIILSVASINHGINLLHGSFFTTLHDSGILIFALAFAISAGLPDTLEFAQFDPSGRRSSILPHRTITHWWPLWGSLFLVAYFLHSNGSYLLFLLKYALMGVSASAFLHLACDAITVSGIPILHPFSCQSAFKKKKGWNNVSLFPCLKLRLIRVGQKMDPIELIIDLIFILSAVWMAYYALTSH